MINRRRFIFRFIVDNINYRFHIFNRINCRCICQPSSKVVCLDFFPGNTNSKSDMSTTR
ncbi:MAG TPA: hypothetical protein EYQ26_02845 [Rhodospirillales bacterium]|nr:hypothetical protein [Rhodospirillales bacterium]